MSKRKCKYCKKLLINLVGESQTCLKLDIIVNMNNDACMDFEFSQKRYDQITEFEKNNKGVEING